MKNKIIIGIIVILTIICISLIIIFPINTTSKKVPTTINNNDVNDENILIDKTINEEKNEDNIEKKLNEEEENGTEINNIENNNTKESKQPIEKNETNNYETKETESYTNNDNKNENNNVEPSTNNNEPIIEEKTIVQEYRQNLAKEVLTLVNQARSENGLSPLNWNTSLEKAAMIRSKELVNNFSHTRPDGSSCFTVININYYTAGENIAAGQYNAQAVFDSWMNSEEHRANILSENFTDIGISLYYDESSSYKYNWVQIFAGI